MRLVCPSQEWISKYQELCFQRDPNFQPWPSRLALLCAEGRELIAGVMVYDTTGPFLFFQHLVTNETAPLRMRWGAVDLMAGEIISMCRMMGKLPNLIVSSSGIARILERHGLQSTHAVSYSCAYSELEKHENPSITPEPPDRFQNPPGIGKPPHRIPEDGPPLRPPVG